MTYKSSGQNETTMKPQGFNPGEAASEKDSSIADPRLLLIGLGSTLRGDDAVGPLIADHFADHPSILAIRAHGLFPEHAELLSHHRLAIIIDAAATGTPGTIAIHRVPKTQTTFETHNLTPDTLLSLTQTLYGRTPRTILITIAADHFNLDHPLSPSAQLAMQKVIKRIHSPGGSPPGVQTKRTY